MQQEYPTDEILNTDTLRAISELGGNGGALFTDSTIDKKMTKENFRLLIKASPTTIAAMGKGEGISPKVLERICMAFACQPGDIMEYVPSQPKQIPLSHSIS